MKSTMGFSPCGTHFGYFGQIQAFFRTLFNRALTQSIA
jgi:hypothetical protein